MGRCVIAENKRTDLSGWFSFFLLQPVFCFFVFFLLKSFLSVLLLSGSKFCTDVINLMYTVHKIFRSPVCTQTHRLIDSNVRWLLCNTVIFGRSSTSIHTLNLQPNLRKPMTILEVKSKNGSKCFASFGWKHTVVLTMHEDKNRHTQNQVPNKQTN